MDFIIVTGLSGAGKTRVINSMEDIGYYCIDNMPTALIPKFADLCMQSGSSGLSRVALVTDVRGGEMFYRLFRELDDLRAQGGEYKILFLEANDDILVRRFHETRRKHPLMDSADGSLQEAISRERELLKPIRARADYILDTSQTTSAQLKERITQLFLADMPSGLAIHCMSFGFKYGAPTEADTVFDVRCLPNPYYNDALRHQTGLDEPVREFVMDNVETQGFVVRLLDMMDYMLPLYTSEGKSQFVVAVGCTGGKHRSVVLTELLYKHFIDQGYRVSVHHRDLTKR